MNVCGTLRVREGSPGQELLRAACMVIRRLGQWLPERGYLNPAQADVAAACAAEASRDLPHAEQLATLLHEHARGTGLDPVRWAHATASRSAWRLSGVQPSALSFAEGIGPVAVPVEASKLAQPGWPVTSLEVGNVYA